MENEDKTSNSSGSDFKDWVNGGIQLTKPWKLALILTNLFWAVVLFSFIWLAYMSPETTYQGQDFEQKTQSQSSGSEVPANDKG